MQENRSSFAQLGFGAILLALVAALLGMKIDSDGGKAAIAAAKGKNLTDKVEARSQPVMAEDHIRFVRSYFQPPPLVDGPAKRAFGSSLCQWMASFFRETIAKARDQHDPCPWLSRDQADNTEVLIVSVPDPIDTPFTCWFDQMVEGVACAAIGVEYTPCLHWFPWEAYRFPKATDRAPSYDACPGVILFHHQDIKRNLLVLLVGETVNGIHQKPLGAALSLAHQLDMKRSQPRHEIRLVAPFFTGSARTLYEALQRWAHEVDSERISFNVIAGSANGLNLDLPGKFLPRSGRHSLQMRSTVFPFEYQQEAALQFLMNHRIEGELHVTSKPSPPDLSKVALLVEYNTGFSSPEQKLAKDSSGLSDNRGPLYLRCPMHVARIRARQEERRAARERRFNPNELSQTNGGAFQQVRPNPETLVSFDENATPEFVDRAVEDLTATIRRNRIRFVGLLLTDPEDVVYFVDCIKRDCPDVLGIFVTGMDLYYALPKNRYSMRGVVVASTYPLFPPNRQWTSPEHPVLKIRDTFQSEWAQGCFNATVIHLAEMEGARVKVTNPNSDQDEVIQKIERNSLREYIPPSFAPQDKYPPVWVVGIAENGRFVVHGVYSYDKDAKSGANDPKFMVLAPLPHTRENGRSVAWPILGTFTIPSILLIVGAAGVLHLLIGRRWIGSALSIRAPTASNSSGVIQRALIWLVSPMKRAEIPVSLWQNFALSIVVTTLAPLCFAFYALCAQPFIQEPTELHYTLLAAGAIAGLLIVIALVLQARCCLRLLTLSSSRRAWLQPVTWLLALGVVLCIATSVGSCGYFLRQLQETKVVRVLFVEGAVNMLTGYSVLPPLVALAAGLLVLVYSALKRHYLNRRFHVQCPYPRPEHADNLLPPSTANACLEVNKASRDLHRELATFAMFWRRRWHWVLLAVLVYVAGATSILYPYRCTPEGWFWTHLYVLGFVLLGGGVVLNLVRFLACWKDLEAILKQIAMLPMVKAFDRLPRKAADLFGGYFLTRRPRGTHLVIPLQLLWKLQEEARDAARKQRRHTAAMRRRSTIASPLQGAARGVARKQRVHSAVGGPSIIRPSLAGVPSPNECPEQIAALLSPDAAWPDASMLSYAKEYPKAPLNRLSHVSRALVGTLARYWPRHSMADAFGESLPATSRENQAGAPGGEAMPAWVGTAEDFVAIQAIVFVSQFFIQLWALAKGLVWASVALVLAAAVYPFQPERQILALQFALLLTVSGVILWVLTRVNKDEIISRITRSTPNKFELSWDFVIRTMVLIGPIALVLLASVSGRLRSLIEPLLDMIR